MCLCDDNKQSRDFDFPFASFGHFLPLPTENTESLLASTMAAFGGGGMNPELAQLLAGGMGAPQRPKPTTAMEHIKDVYADPFKW